MRQPIAVGLLAFTFTAFAAACGPTSGTSGVIVSPTAAYSATMSASSAEVHAVLAVTPSNPTAAGTTTAESGPLSWSAGQGDLTTTANIVGVSMLTAEEIVDGSNTYTKVLTASGLASRGMLGITSRGGWTESRWAGTPPSSGASPSALLDLFSQGLAGALPNVTDQPPGGLSPTTLLAALRVASTTVVEVGAETIGGAATTHYRGQIPFARLGGITAAFAAQMLLHTSSFPVDYWVDSQQRVRQLRLSVVVPALPVRMGAPPPQPTTATTTDGNTIVWSAPVHMTAVGVPYQFPVTVSLTLQLSEYGTAVRLAIPPAADITSIQSCAAAKGGCSCEGT